MRWITSLQRSIGGRWIPISDALPPNSDIVAVRDASGKEGRAQWIEDDDLWLLYKGAPREFDHWAPLDGGEAVADLRDAAAPLPTPAPLQR